MLKSQLSEIAAELGPAVERAVKKGAETVMADAKIRVPVDEDDFDPKNHLRDAIHLERDDTTDGWLVVARNHDVFYGHMVEHGTVHSAPRPFLVPALEQNRRVIEEEIAAALRRIT